MRKILLLNIILIFCFVGGLWMIQNLDLNPKVVFEVETAFPKNTDLLVSCLFDSGIPKVFDRTYAEKKSQGAVQHIIGDGKFRKYTFDLSKILPSNEPLTGLWFEWTTVDKIIRFKSFTLKSFLSHYRFTSEMMADNFDTWRSQMVAVHDILYFKPGGINWIRWKRWWIQKRQDKMKYIYTQVKNGYKKSLMQIFIAFFVVLAVSLNVLFLKKAGFKLKY